MQSWILENVEVLIRLIIVVKNQNCQAYLCVFLVFSILSVVLSIYHFQLTAIRFPHHNKMAGDDEESVLQQAENGKSTGQRRGWKN